MKVRIILGWLVLLSLVAAIGYAQEGPVRRLSVAEALDIARRNNPDYLATLNDRWTTAARQRSTTASLFTPTFTVSGSEYHAGSGSRTFSGLVAQSPGSTIRSWSLGFNYNLSGTTIANRGLAAADARATDADISGAVRVLDLNVRSQYLSLLQAKAQAALARHSVERATEGLSLAQARYGVGQATLIDVRRAEVDKGQAEVNLLTANQAVDNETLKMFQQLGVPAPEPVQLELTDSFPVTQPTLVEDSLIRVALDENPGLRSLRARAASAHWSVRAAMSQYLPSLNLSASYGKYRNAVDSNLTTNAPPSVTTGVNPFSYSIYLSLPIYDGFSRGTQVAQAHAQDDDMRQAIRGRELSVRAGVSAAYRALVAAYQRIGLQQRNKVAAAEALDLATQRYRVGSGTYIELLDARVAAEKADADYVGAVYDYHKSIAALENAVGRPLR